MKILVCFTACIWFFTVTTSDVLGTVYRTPSGRKAVCFNPMAWSVGFHGSFLQSTAYDQGYEYIPYIQLSNPHSFRPGVNLEDLLFEIRDGNVGVLRIETMHSGYIDGFLVEIFGEEGESLRNNWYEYYLVNTTLQPNQIVCEDYSFVSPPMTIHAITLTSEGIRFITNEMFPDSLVGSIVFQSICYSDDENDDWNALSVMGYDGIIFGTACEDTLWQRMNGTRDRVNRVIHWGFPPWLVPSNKHRATEDAASGIHTICEVSGLWYYANLLCGHNGHVVLSPVVLKHEPKSNEVIGGNRHGYVEFDCEMDNSIDPETIVYLTGFGYQINPWLGHVRWAPMNNHKIEFTIPDIPGYGWADFLVWEDNARSLYNGIKLDGDTWPPGQNGVGPDSDCYGWTSRLINLPLIDFEDGEDGEILTDQYSSMYGVHFDGGYEPGNPNRVYEWQLRTPNPLSNVYPFHGQTSIQYPVYWVDDALGAWIGDLSGCAIKARISFSALPMGVYLGYTSTGTTIKVYGMGNWEQCAATYHIYENQPLTHSLREVWLGPPAGAPIDSIIFYNTENRFGIDNMMICNEQTMGMGALPPGFTIIESQYGSGFPGGDPAVYTIQVDATVDSFQVVLNWYSSDNLALQLDLLNPQGESIFMEHNNTPPIITEPVILNPREGEWSAKVSVFSNIHREYHYALVGGAGYEPMVDGYLKTEDIKWYPESPGLGDRIYIYGVIHCGDKFQEPIPCLPVRCYLGNPDAGVQIDEDEYALDLNPSSTSGNVDTVYFNFDTDACVGMPSCEVYIVIDPDKIVEEYNETNNEASREIIFAPEIHL